MAAPHLNQLALTSHLAQSLFADRYSSSAHVFGRCHPIKSSEEETLSGNDTVESRLEPRDSVVGLNLVLSTDSGLLLLSDGNSGSGSSHDDVEVHTENT